MTRRKVVIVGKNSVISLDPEDIQEVSKKGFMEASHNSGQKYWHIQVVAEYQNFWVHFDTEEEYEAAYNTIIAALMLRKQNLPVFQQREDSKPIAVPLLLSEAAILAALKKFSQSRKGWKVDDFSVYEEGDSDDFAEVYFGVIDIPEKLLMMLEGYYIPITQEEPESD